MLIASCSEQLFDSKQQASQLLKTQRDTLDDLEMLGDVMQDMLYHQEHIEVVNVLHPDASFSRCL